MTQNWTERNVLILGGSEGLGYQLAHTFRTRGAQVGLVARDRDRLQAAAERLGGCRQWSCDVTRDGEVHQLFQSVTAEWKRLDVLVNAVGRSERRLAMGCTVEDFQAAFELNFLSVVRCTRAALPLLTASQGSIVNIGSLASKIAVANMGTYSASKFALAAYSQQLRFELAQQQTHVHVLLVCPGPSRRPDAGQRYAPSEGVPEQALLPAGGARICGMDPALLAAQIVRACERRWTELVRPRYVRILLALQALSPALADVIVRKAMRI